MGTNEHLGHTLNELLAPTQLRLNIALHRYDRGGVAHELLGLLGAGAEGVQQGAVGGTPGVKHQQAVRTVFLDAGGAEVVVEHSRRMRRDSQKRIGMGGASQFPDQVAGKRLKAGSAVLGPFCFQPEPAAIGVEVPAPEVRKLACTQAREQRDFI